MCSFLFTNQQDFDLNKVNYLLQKRGPDHTGIHTENNYTYIHNLLSITGDFFTQPLVSESIVALFNGEIYNYKEFGNFKNDSECLVKIYHEEYLNRIDGEFAIFIHDKVNEKFILVTDTFGTKPLYWATDGDKIGVCSYPDPLKILGFKNPIRCKPNTILTLDSKTLSKLSEEILYEFDLQQKKQTYTDWKLAFRKSVEKRIIGTRHNILVPLSSGYDSGLISAVLNELDFDYVSYSIIGSENKEVLNSRFRINTNSRKEVIPSLDSSKKNEVKHLFSKDVQHFGYGPNPLEITHDGFEDPGSIGLYTILMDSLDKHETRIVLSGQGSDEIMSNIQTYGFKTQNPGIFEEDLGKIFPWGNFYEGSQWSYLMKEECIAGSLGIETRYPFLDRMVVQEYLWLTPDLKNAAYKSPIKSYLDDLEYPYHQQKIGFNIDQ